MYSYPQPCLRMSRHKRLFREAKHCLFVNHEEEWKSGWLFFVIIILFNSVNSAPRKASVLVYHSNAARNCELIPHELGWYAGVETDSVLS